MFGDYFGDFNEYGDFVEFDDSPATEADAVREYVRNVADDDPASCGCRGGGWILSNYDTWHSCPAHGHTGLPHPEDHPF